MPSPLAVGELSEEARALIWAALFKSIRSTGSTDPFGRSSLGEFWTSCMMEWHVRRDHKPIDEFRGSYAEVATDVKQKALSWHLPYLFDFLTFVLRHYGCPPSLTKGIISAFVDARLAYAINDKTIYPVASRQEGEAVQAAFYATRATEYNGARSHMEEAGRLLTAGQWANSVRESIHAVESVAKVIEPRASTLSDALRKLAAASRMNPNLKKALEALYSYTSDEQGIRHANVFSGESAVDQAEAVFMFGACASFVSYLVSKKVTA